MILLLIVLLHILSSCLLSEDWVTLLLFVLFKDLPQSTRLFAFLCLGRKTIVLSKMPGLVTQSRLLELEVMLQGVPKKVLIEQNHNQNLVLWG